MRDCDTIMVEVEANNKQITALAEEEGLKTAQNVVTGVAGFVVPILWFGMDWQGPYNGKVVGLAFAAGALTHVLLFLGYGLFKSEVIGSSGLLVYAAVIGSAPIILAALGSRFFKPQLLRPIPVQ